MTHGVEERLGSLLQDSALDQLATLAVEAYGGELFGFLVHVIGDPGRAEDVFAQTVEDFWRGLPGFRGRCRVRTWLYELAHHASLRPPSPSDRAPRAGRAAPPPLVGAVRTLTVSWRRGDAQDKWREIRGEIAPEDRALLVLRVDRDLAWDEIARVMLGETAEDAPADAVPREAVRLRKRFHVLRHQLRARARDAGLR